jgi:hypothetical protein
MTKTSKPKHVTVVVRLDDPEAAQPWLNTVGAAFAGKENIPGITVTGMANSDEMTRVEYLEGLLDEEHIHYDQA